MIRNRVLGSSKTARVTRADFKVPTRFKISTVAKLQEAAYQIGRRPITYNTAFSKGRIYTFQDIAICIDELLQQGNSLDEIRSIYKDVANVSDTASRHIIDVYKYVPRDSYQRIVLNRLGNQNSCSLSDLIPVLNRNTKALNVNVREFQIRQIITDHEN